MPAARIDVRPALSGDATAISAFLSEIFRLPSTAALIDPRHLAWKYWTSRPDWQGSRSFTARHGEQIVAHVAAWPTRIRLVDRDLPAAHLIDWASDPRFPGSGIWLIRQVRAKARVLIATGGTEMTRRTLPVLGFRPIGNVYAFARPVRPLRQALTTPQKTWRLPARAARNTLWRVAQPGTPADWSAAPAEPDEIPRTVWPQPAASAAVTARDAGIYRYVVSSPAARHALFTLKRGSEAVGYFCLCYAKHVVRIADLWVASTAVDDWCAGFRTAAAFAGRTPDACEVTAWASTARAKQALAGAGFRLRDSCWLSIFGDGRLLDGHELHVQMLDCDASFLGADEVDYLT
jgi:hypothetical protein